MRVLQVCYINLFEGLNYIAPLVQLFWKSFQLEFKSTTNLFFYFEFDILVEKNNSAIKSYCLLLHIERDQQYEMS